MYIEKAVCQTLNKIVQLSLLFHLVGYTVVGRCLEAGNQNSCMIANLKNHSPSRGFYFGFCFHFHVGKQKKKTKELIDQNNYNTVLQPANKNHYYTSKYTFYTLYKWSLLQQTTGQERNPIF